MWGSSSFNVGAGTYTAYVKDGFGCLANSQPRKITESDNPLAISYTVVKKASCDGGANGSVTINISGGTPDFKINISMGATTVVNTTTSQNTYNISTISPDVSYTVTVTDKRGCEQTTYFTIGKAVFNITGVLTSPSLCDTKQTGQISFNVENGAANYNFSLYKKVGASYTENTANKESIAVANASFTDLYTGYYKLTVSESKGCTAVVADIFVDVTNPKIIVGATESSKALCNNSPTGATSNTIGNRYVV